MLIFEKDCGTRNDPAKQKLTCGNSVEVKDIAKVGSLGPVIHHQDFRERPRRLVKLELPRGAVEEFAAMH
jgi:hypothetical protein